MKGGLVHAGHAGAVVLSWETVDVDFKRDRANRWTEVKQTHLLDKDGWGQRGREGRMHISLERKRKTDLM